MARYYDFNRETSVPNSDLLEGSIYGDFHDCRPRHQMCALKRNKLHIAVISCDFDEVEQLIEEGVDVNGQDAHGNTALHLAYANQDTFTEEFANIITLLEQNKARKDIKNNYGQTVASLQKSSASERSGLSMMFDAPPSRNDAI